MTCIIQVDEIFKTYRGFALRAIAKAVSRDPVAFVAIRRTSS
jgi:hypothetical protein